MTSRLLNFAERHPWWLFLAYFIVTACFYQLALRAPFGTPTMVPALSWDHAIPLVPWTAWIYLSYFALMPSWVVATRRHPEPRTGARLLLAGMLVVVGNLAINNLVPTEMTRVLSPEGAGGWPLSAVIAGDTPRAALPSGHVALPTALTVLAFVGRLRSRGLYALWAALLTASVLTTRQHVLLDAIAGLVYGSLGAGIAFRLTSTTPSKANGGSSRPALAWPTVRALIIEVAVCVVCMGGAMAHFRWWTVLPAMVIVATRQHALFILYHDAVHVLIARKRRLNDFIINVAAGVPMLLPVHLYRRFHMSHHTTLGSENDTERVLLYRYQPWNYRPLPAWKLALQLLGDVFLVNQALTGLSLFLEKRKSDSRLRLPSKASSPETLVLQGLFFSGLAIWGYLDIASLGRFSLLWFVPLVTLTMAIQKVRSFAEHADLDAPELTYSWNPGLAGRLVLWPYNIGYHREHHTRPGVPWYELPVAFPDVEQRPGRTLLALLLRRR